MVRSRLFAMLAVATVAGMLVAVVPLNQAGASAAGSPPHRGGMGMAYDSARGQVVMFGGSGNHKELNDTWTWTRTSWTRQHPVTSPSPRDAMGFAYDAARGQVVLFGGTGPGFATLGDMWTWDGTNWTEQHPATLPSPRVRTEMAYDPTRGEVMLFGGATSLFGSNLGDTWTWDGTNWTEQHPATSPSARIGMGLAYDAALGEVVLFGGQGDSGFVNDTWTWDGTTWTQQHPAKSPPARVMMGMTYDAARGGVVLFGGQKYPRDHGDTWTWDGTTWTKERPATSPSARAFVRMSYDSAGTDVVLFGGWNVSGRLGDTWTWNGTNWRIPFKAHAHVSPNSGPPGTAVEVTGTGFAAFETVNLAFIDSVNGKTVLGTSTTDAKGRLAAQVTVPANATVGPQKVTVAGKLSHQKATAKFTVT